MQSLCVIVIIFVQAQVSACGDEDWIESAVKPLGMTSGTVWAVIVDTESRTLKAKSEADFIKFEKFILPSLNNELNVELEVYLDQIWIPLVGATVMDSATLCFAFLWYPKVTHVLQFGGYRVPVTIRNTDGRTYQFEIIKGTVPKGWGRKDWGTILKQFEPKSGNMLDGLRCKVEPRVTNEPRSTLYGIVDASVQNMKKLIIITFNKFEHYPETS